MNKLVERKVTETALALPGDADPYEAYASEGRYFSGDLLKFSKRGLWSRGRDNLPVPSDLEFIAQMRDLNTGWVLWRAQTPHYDNRLIGSLRDRFVPPARMSLGHLDATEWEPDPGGGPRRDPFVMTDFLVLVERNDRDQVLTFAPSSKGGRAAIRDLMRVCTKHWKTAPNDLPVVALDSDSYVHRAYGEIPFPILLWRDWVTAPAEALVPVDTETDDGRMILDDQVPF